MAGMQNMIAVQSDRVPVPVIDHFVARGQRWNFGCSTGFVFGFEIVRSQSR